jgi:geranylgeranyl diphosphate synthase type I
MSKRPDSNEALVLLDAYRRRADARLAALFASKQDEWRTRPFAADRYVSLLGDYALRGGKRVRGALVVLGHEAVSPVSSPEALEGSLAFELLHAFLLAYDDVMDRDELRRGGPALHVAAGREAAARGSSDAAHRGLSVTMLLGLVAQAMAFDCLDRAGALPKARRWFDRVSEGVTLGQLLDVIAADAPGAGPEEIAQIHRLKTGLYTTEGPVVLGALLAGADPDGAQVAALRGWAVPVGEAFQLVDDILGAVGDSDETGKPASGDLREGKRTAVLEEALLRLEGAPRSALASLAGRPLDAREAAEARALVVSSGAVEAVRARAQGLVDAAGRSLEGAGLDAAAVGSLAALAQLVVDRQN